MASTDDLYDKLDPFERLKWQQKTIAIVPKITGSVSFIASSVMVYMILRSDVNVINQDPFRRIIFMMCVMDILKSITLIISTTASPEDTPGVWGAMGNTTTCDISGWILQFSSTAQVMYVCSLSIHYFFFIQYKIKRLDFSRKVEPFLHGVPILWSIFGATWLVSTQNINNAEVVCWTASLPYNCINDPNTDCERGENTVLLRAIFKFVPSFVSFILTSLVMYKTYMIYKTRERVAGSTVNCEFSQEPAPDVMVRRRSRILFRTEEALIQSYLMIGSVCACYVFIYIDATLEFFKIDTPFSIKVEMWIFFPLQGFFNIIVFTRPHVVLLKKYDRNLTTLQAIWKVIKSGGSSALLVQATRRIRVQVDDSSIVESRPPSQIIGDGPPVSSIGYMEESFFADNLSDVLYGDTGFDIYDDDDITLDPVTLEPPP